MFAQVELQKKKHSKLDRQLRLRDDRRLELDLLEEDYHRKRREINRRYNELLNAEEQCREESLLLLTGNDAASGGRPVEAPAAAAASQDHQVLLSEGPLRGVAGSHVHPDANGSLHVSICPDEPRHDDLISQHEEATAMETDQGHVECDADEVVPDSEDEHEGSPQEEFGRLHACQADSEQPGRLQSSLAAPIADGRKDRDEQGSGQSGTMVGPEREAVNVSEPGMQDGMNAAEPKHKESVKGRLGDTFYMHREPRSASEASESLDALHASFMP